VSITLVNLGTDPTGVGGDDKRDAFAKVNASLTDLDTTKADQSAVDAALALKADQDDLDAVEAMIGTTGRAWRTQTTSASAAGQWGRIARYEIVDQYSDVSATWLALETGGSMGIARQAIVRFRAKQQAAFGSDPVVEMAVDHLGDTKMEADFVYVITRNTPTTYIDLYAAANVTYTRLDGYEIGENTGGTVVRTYFDLEALSGTTTPPAGAVAANTGRYVRADQSAQGYLLTSAATAQLTVRPSVGGAQAQLLASASADETFIRNATGAGTVDGSIIIKGGDNTVRFRPGDTSGTQHVMWHAGNLPYETGTWTPVLAGFTSVSYITSSTYGRYTRVGDYVYLNVRIATNSQTSPISFAFGFTLPFTLLANRHLGAIGMFTTLNYDGSRPILGLYTNSVGTAANVYASGDALGWSGMTGTSVGTSGFQIIFSGGGYIA